MQVKSAACMNSNMPQTYIVYS